MPTDDGYETLYREFNSPVMQQIRREAYGEDIGQHSWVDADEVRGDIARLRLSPSSRLLDLGCGPCGPLTFILATVGCAGTGVDVSSAALRAGRERAVFLGVERLLSIHQADLDQPLPFGTERFDAAIMLDAVLHVHDRERLFHDVARVLQPGGHFLFTDAGVVTGAVSNEEMRKRCAYGYTQLVPVGWNEHLLQSSGLRLIETGNRTAGALQMATGRSRAIEAHRTELEYLTSDAEVVRQMQYLEIVVELSRRGALSRMMYLAQR